MAAPRNISTGRTIPVGGQTFDGLVGLNQSVNPPPIPVADIHLFGASGDDTAFLIWRWAEYQDVFSDTTHRTEFGFRVWIDGNIAGKSIIRFEPTEGHNAADERQEIEADAYGGSHTLSI